MHAASPSATSARIGKALINSLPVRAARAPFRGSVRSGGWTGNWFRSSSKGLKAPGARDVGSGRQDAQPASPSPVTSARQSSRSTLAGRSVPEDLAGKPARVVEDLERMDRAVHRGLAHHPGRADPVGPQVQVEARIEHVEPRPTGSTRCTGPAWICTQPRFEVKTMTGSPVAAAPRAPVPPRPPAPAAPAPARRAASPAPRPTPKRRSSRKNSCVIPSASQAARSPGTSTASSGRVAAGAGRRANSASGASGAAQSAAMLSKARPVGRRRSRRPSGSPCRSRRRTAGSAAAPSGCPRRAGSR